jgi:hypothetical protein
VLPLFLTSILVFGFCFSLFFLHSLSPDSFLSGAQASEHEGKACDDARERGGQDQRPDPVRDRRDCGAGPPFVVVDANRRPIVGEHGLTAAGLPPACLYAPQVIHVGLHLPRPCHRPATYAPPCTTGCPRGPAPSSTLPPLNSTSSAPAVAFLPVMHQIWPPKLGGKMSPTRFELVSHLRIGTISSLPFP